MIKQRFVVKDMHCTGCVMAVEGSIEKVPGVKRAEANYAREFADVEYDETQVTEEQIRQAVERAGYTFVGVAGK